MVCFFRGMWAKCGQKRRKVSMEPLKRLVSEAFRRWVRVPLEALLETARDGGFPLFSNGFGIIAIHCDSTLFHGGLWKNVGNV